MGEQNFETAADVAYNIIAQKILDGEYPPGMKLSRRKMAEVTGVSVIPVIEALKRLENDNLVESRPQWGSFVTIPTKKKIMEFYQVREALEAEAARLLCKSITAEQLQSLRDIATELDTVPYSEAEAGELRESHLKFHLLVAEYTGNEILYQTLNRVNLFWILSRALTTRASTSVYPRYWHRKLVDIIAMGDEERAAKAMREHVEDSLNPMLEAAEDH